MQATTTTRRFDPRQIKQAALAIAILTSAAIGVTTASIVRDAGDSDRGRTVVVSAPVAREQAFGYQFLEQNLDLPTGIAAPAVNRYADYQFMEQNLNLPASDIASATNPAVDYRYLEMNLELPGTAASTTPNWRMADQNSRREGFVPGGSTSQLLPPSATDVLRKYSPETSW